MGGELALLADESAKRHKREGGVGSFRWGIMGGSRGSQQWRRMSRSNCGVCEVTTSADRVPVRVVLGEYSCSTLQHTVVHIRTWLRVGRAECK